MNLFIRFVAVVAPIIGTLLLWAAQVGPEDAMSNLGKWARLIGVDAPPAWLTNQSADTWATVGGFFAIAIGLAASAVLIIRSRSRKRPMVPPSIISATATTERFPAIRIATAKGRVTFDSSTHDGMVTVGPNDAQVRFSFSLASRNVVHVRRCLGTIEVARAKNVGPGDIVDFSSLDSTSHSYRVSVGELFLAKSEAGYFAQARIVSLMCEGHGDDRDEVVFDYEIQDSPRFVAI